MNSKRKFESRLYCNKVGSKPWAGIFSPKEWSLDVSVCRETVTFAMFDTCVSCKLRQGDISEFYKVFLLSFARCCLFLMSDSLSQYPTR